jgi:hypothetical protein
MRTPLDAVRELVGLPAKQANEQSARAAAPPVRSPRRAPEVRPAPPVPRMELANQRRHGPGAPLLLALLAAIILVVVVVVVHHHGLFTSNQAQKATIAAEAQAVNRLLNESATARSALRRGIDDVKGCSKVAKGFHILRKVAAERVHEVKRAESLDMRALPDGAALKADLIKTLRYSRRADHDYRSWSRQVLLGGCWLASNKSSHYSAAATASRRATTAKKSFLRLWNPIAEQQGFRSRSQAHM